MNRIAVVLVGLLMGGTACAQKPPLLPEQDVAEIAQEISGETAKRNLKRLSDAGVKYGFGTDAGPPGRFPGFFEQWEMELMVEAGLTPSQVIRAATKSAAEFLHAKDLGTLESGKWADLVVLNADPLKNIHNTRTIQSVYIAGNRVAGGK